MRPAQIHPPALRNENVGDATFEARVSARLASYSSIPWRLGPSDVAQCIIFSLEFGEVSGEFDVNKTRSHSNCPYEN